MPFERLTIIIGNVGLREAAKMNVGTTAGTVMAGDDSRVTSMKSAAKRDVGTGASQIPDMNSFVSSLVTNGYQKLPGGLIIQWGSVEINVPTAGTTVSLVVTLPIAFPTGTLWNGGVNVNTTAPNAVMASTTGGGRTGITVYLYKASVGSNVINWMALGY